MADGSITVSVTADDRDAQKKLNQLRRDIEKTSRSMGENTAKRNAIAEQLEVARAEAEKTAEALRELRAQQAENESVLSGQSGSVDFEEFLARQQAQGEISEELERQESIYANQVKEVQKLEKSESGLASTIEGQTGRLTAMQEEAGGIERVLARTSGETAPQLGAAIENVSKTVKKGFKNILKWGFGIRSAFILMRRLRSAIKEGINTFAEYDTETKKSIGGLKNSLAALKVSWGAAFAPILNAVAPILQRLISWLATAANYVQMFFNVLAGKNTYKKVIASNDALAKSYGGAGKAAKDAQKQLMGFDEINKLDDKSGGGGGGGGGSNAGIEGVDEEMIPADTMKKLTWLKDHLQEILTIAGAIGGALLLWKIGNSFTASLGKVLGLAIAIYGAIQFIRTYIDAWNNGVNLGNVIDMFTYLGIVVIGLAIAFGKTGAAIGLLVGGVAMLVLGFKEWIETGELSWETFMLLAGGIAAVAGGIALLTGSWIPLLIAAIAIAVGAIVKLIVDNWDKIKGFFEKIKNGIVNKVTEIKNKIIEIVTNTKNKIKEIVDKIKGFFEGIKIEFPHIKLPHLVVNWVDASNSPLAQLFGINAIPDMHIEWFAKGGVVDGATLIGAGDAGKEAIVPLERNTQWIHMVADGLLDALVGNNKFAQAISQLPAVANGQIVPPRAISGGGSMFTDGDIQKLVSGLTAALGDGEHITRLYLDGRQIAEVVTKEQRRMERSYA